MTPIFLITPPFTQLNTPYPATAYLKGFLNTKGIDAHQADLGIETILKIFSSKGLQAIFRAVDPSRKISKNSRRILHLHRQYIAVIDAVMLFLQNKNPTLAYLICTGNYLPEASRFNQVADMEWAFGQMGSQDKARHLVTLFLEDIGDLIIECIDPHFGFSRYAERLGMSANSFDAIYSALQQPYSYIDHLLIEILDEKMRCWSPLLVCISVPFPGNLFGALRCGQYIKENFPGVKVAMGGGFANTELRSISDPRVFEFLDFITLDDGETPVLHLIEYMENKRPAAFLKRTFLLEDGTVKYCNGSLAPDMKQAEVGAPDYNDLLLDKYLSVIEIANPMHRLWSDGRWNKLTLAHGCYWGKCTFCDISLDYIANYEATTAKVLADRIEMVIAQTGEHGFHFVDEAAPPALMRELALEILRRNLTVSWWTNIRFEKSFTRDLCQLLAASGCIAVSGGLEVASDRLLTLMKKGVTVHQVARVADHFTQSGIMVHAYLMYGFPTQTVQETIDALENVRQLFENGVIHSAFWHQFAMTAHSPVGLYPEQFNVKRSSGNTGTFANNDLQHEDPTGADHPLFSDGLKKSLLNYMHGMCLDWELQEWFSFKVPATSLPPNYIERALQDVDIKIRNSSKMVWIGTLPEMRRLKGGKVQLQFFVKKGNFEIDLDGEKAALLCRLLELVQLSDERQLCTLGELEQAMGSTNLEKWLNSNQLETLRGHGLLVL